MPSTARGPFLKSRTRPRTSIPAEEWCDMRATVRASERGQVWAAPLISPAPGGDTEGRARAAGSRRIRAADPDALERERRGVGRGPPREPEVTRAAYRFTAPDAASAPALAADPRLTPRDRAGRGLLRHRGGRAAGARRVSHHAADP